MNDQRCTLTFLGWEDEIRAIMHFKTHQDANNYVASIAKRKTVYKEGDPFYDCFERKNGDWHSYIIEPYKEPDFLECEKPAEHTLLSPLTPGDMRRYYREQADIDAMMHVNGYNPEGTRWRQ